MPPSSQYTHSRGPPPTGCIRAAHKPTARSVRLRAHAPPCAEVVCCDLLAFLQDPARPVCPTAATRRQDPDGASRAGSHLLILHTGTAVQRSFHVGLWYQAERPRCACAWRPCGRGACARPVLQTLSVAGACRAEIQFTTSVRSRFGNKRCLRRRCSQPGQLTALRRVQCMHLSEVQVVNCRRY